MGKYGGHPRILDPPHGVRDVAELRGVFAVEFEAFQIRRLEMITEHTEC